MQYCTTDLCLCFLYTVSTILLLSKSEIKKISSHLLCVYCPVCVGPVRKTHCEFSHDEAQICFYCQTSHPKAKIRSTRGRKRCDAQKKEK